METFASSKPHVPDSTVSGQMAGRNARPQPDNNRRGTATTPNETPSLTHPHLQLVTMVIRVKKSAEFGA
ncbi:Hypp6305 [Branchiostoma lanceolatum]|uniref:Hypp6305 protein n=1 Tax=Branchiostoma lanceolatum TaxID=7740 RepID=A0A8K0E538_BRALA|nr:Hypp6305 [Branchiostoma lanceolatum]